MSIAALDALQDVTGVNRVVAAAAPAPAGTSVDPAKLELYQSMIAQLREDGLMDEAKMLASKLNLPAGSGNELFSIFQSHVELERLRPEDAVAKQWSCLRPRPLPPVGPNEDLFDLRNYKVAADIEEDEEDTDNMEDVVDKMAAVQRRPPPQFKTRYTAQHKQGVRSAAFSFDGRLCASGSMDTSIKVMDTSRMRMFGVVSGTARAGLRSAANRADQPDELRPVIRTYYDHVGTVTSLSFHPRQPILFSGSVDKTVKMFDLTRGGVNKKAMVSISDVSPVTCVHPHACGDFVLVGTQHPVVRLYDISTQQCFTSYHQTTSVVSQHRATVTDIKSASDGSVFASTAMDGNVLLWDGVANRAVNRLVGQHNMQPVYSCQWSRNNRYLLTGGGDHRIRVWDVRTGRQLLVYAPQPRSQQCSNLLFSFLHGEEYLLAASSDAEESDVALIEATTGSVVIPKFDLHAGGPARCLATCPTDLTFISGGDDMKVRYVELSAGDLEGADADVDIDDFS